MSQTSKIKKHGTDTDVQTFEICSKRISNTLQIWHATITATVTKLMLFHTFILVFSTFLLISKKSVLCWLWHLRITTLPFSSLLSGWGEWNLTGKWSLYVCWLSVCFYMCSTWVFLHVSTGSMCVVWCVFYVHESAYGVCLCVMCTPCAVSSNPHRILA